MTKTADDGDEVRRLLYMTLAAPDTKKYNLVGTLTNALLHHRGLDGDWRQIMDHLIEVADGAPARANSEQWVLDQIGLITAELGD